MVTVGMNYEVLEGKAAAFEAMFARVVEALATLPGHVATHLYNEVGRPTTYLVVSEWETRAHFDAFIESEAFRKTTRWGSDSILASRPRHEVYGSAPLSGGGCPVDHGAPARRVGT